MTTVKININTINDVKDFVTIVSRCEYDVDIVSGRYAIDAKSIMGIFSLDLSKAIDLNIHAADGALDDILTVLKPYLVD